MANKKTKDNLLTAIMILIALLICVADSLFSQETPIPFFSLGVSNKGAIIQAGVFYERVEVNVQYKPIVYNLQNNSVVSASIGYKFLDWFTPAIGVGYYSRTDFTAYDNDATGKTGFTKVAAIAPIYSLEVRHTWWFVGVSHCDQTFFTAGLKFHRKFN